MRQTRLLVLAATGAVLTLTAACGAARPPTRVLAASRR